MSEIFLSVLNTSLTASYVIIFVILIRLLLKKSPKVISYALWGVVAFRLTIPFSFESMLSLMPRNTNVVPIPHDIIYQQSPQINSGIGVVDTLVNNSLPAPTIGASVNPLQIYLEIGAYIWALGIIALLVYSFVSILILKRQLENSRLIEENIFEAKNLKTPFVLGLIKPKIYLPVGLNDTERSYILLHEQIHIKRKDHIIKVLSFLILSVHWFNPLVWIAFILMSKDMELSCDERVLKQINNEDIKKPYASSLLSLATEKHILNGSPLAFGEGNVRGRIKNVLDYKKPKFWIVLVSIFAVVIVGFALLANPLGEEAIFNRVRNRDGYTIYEIQKPITFTAYIEPTWIPKNEDEVIELNKEIGKVGKVGILIESVMHRGNDIYFNFDAKQFINNDSGEFLYNDILNEDGTATSYNLWDAFNIYNNNTKIDVGQRGYGPGSKFSFGINIENYDVIKDGFTLKFNGGILYGYSNLESIGSNGTSNKGVIKVNNILYRQSDERINKLPPDAYEIGMLESILHNKNEVPERNFQGAMLDEKYAGNLLYQSKNQNDVLYLEDLSGYYIIFDRIGQSQSLSDRRPMIMVNGDMYLDTGKEVSVEIDESAIIGEISSSVDQSEKPTKEGQSNFGNIGAKYAHFEENIVVLLNNEWVIFEKEIVDSVKESSENTNYEKISAYLKEKSANTFSVYYELLDFIISDYHEGLVDENVEAIFSYTIVHKNYDRDPDTVQYIKEAKERGDKNYQTYYDEYLQPQNMNFYFKAVVDDNDTITLFTKNPAIENHDWEEVEMSEFVIGKITEEHESEKINHNEPIENNIAEYISYDFEYRSIYIAGLKIFEEFGTKEFGYTNEGSARIINDENALEFFITVSTGLVPGAGTVTGPEVYFKIALDTNKIVEKKLTPAPNYPEAEKLSPEHVNPDSIQYNEKVIELSDERIVEIGLYLKEFILETESKLDYFTYED